MLSFFRSIRQRLLSKNEVTRYIIYAIGEIALVMIGILLALQVNNWNEGRKNIKKEVIYLQNFKKDLEFEISRQKETLNKTAYKISVFKALDPSFHVWANMTNHITENINLDSIRLVDVFRRGSNNRFVNGTYNTLKDKCMQQSQPC